MKFPFKFISTLTQSLSHTEIAQAQKNPSSFFDICFDINIDAYKQHLPLIIKQTQSHYIETKKEKLIELGLRYSLISMKIIDVPSQHPLVPQEALLKYQEHTLSLCIEASFLFEPVCVFLGYQSKIKANHVQIKHYYTPTTLRSLRLESYLLKALQDFLKKENITYLEVASSSEKNPHQFSYSSLQNLGYSPPRIDFIYYYFHMYNELSSIAHLSRVKTPKGIEILSWVDILSRKIPIQKTRQSLTPSSFFEPTTSLGAICENKVIGWLLTQPKDSRTLFYSTSFISKEWRQTSLALSLLVKAIHLQHAQRDRFPLMAWKTSRYTDRSQSFYADFFKDHFAVKISFFLHGKCL